MSHKSTLPILMALILAHIILAALYMVHTPYRTGGLVSINPSVEKDIGAPDERQHANYIWHLMHSEGFPVFDPKDPQLYEDYQYHQPPLYYVLGTGWGEIWQVDPKGEAIDGQILRSLNLLIGALGVLGVFFLAFWGYHRERLALTAAAFAGLLPMNLALSGAISNDPLLICLCTWVLALLARVVRGHWDLKRAIAIGLLTGAAILTKTTAVALIPVVVMAMVVNKPKWQYVAVVAVLGFGLALPWWTRNQLLYGDPLAMSYFTKAFGGSATKEFMEQNVIPKIFPRVPVEFNYWVYWIGFWTARSFLGVFGYMDIWLTQSGQQSWTFDENRLYWVAILLFFVGFVGWVLSWRDDRFRHGKKVRALNLTFFLIVLLLFIRFDATYFQAQARYILPALGPIACGFAAGYRELCKKYKQIPLYGVVAFLLMVNTFALIRIGPAFDQRIEDGKRFESKAP